MDGRIALYHSDIFTRNNVGTSEQINDLYNQIKLAQQENRNPMVLNNDDCWRSSAKYPNDNWLMEAVKEMTQLAAEYYFSLDESFLHHVPDKTIKVNYWTNVNSPGAKNVLHNHQEDTFAAVFYLQAKDTGNLIYTNPANLLSQCNPASPFSRGLSIEPEDNQLILWPAWVPHEVEANPSNKERINLAFSIRIS